MSLKFSTNQELFRNTTHFIFLLYTKSCKCIKRKAFFGEFSYSGPAVLWTILFVLFISYTCNNNNNSLWIVLTEEANSFAKFWHAKLFPSSHISYILRRGGGGNIPPVIYKLKTVPNSCPWVLVHIYMYIHVYIFLTAYFYHQDAHIYEMFTKIILSNKIVICYQFIISVK